MELPGIARFLMLNIYCPNKDNPEFLTRTFKLLENNTIRNWILCGDWNLVLNQCQDTYNYQKINNPQSTKTVTEFIKKYDILDIWRQKNPNVKKFTWFRTNPTKAARLDFFLISSTILDIFSDCYIAFKYRSDHCKIGLKLHLDKTTRGKGTWKLNAELLNDSDLVKLIEEGIHLMVEVHACTPYAPSFVKHFHKHNIELMIKIDIFWEVLLSHLRGIFISHAAKKKREKSNREIHLHKEIENLEELHILDINDEELKVNLERKKQELEELRDIKLKGSFIRSRLKDYVQGEKPSKHFLNLENYNFISKNIKELELDDGTTIVTPRDILEEMRRFYQSLYNFKYIIPIEDSKLADFPKHFRKLSQKEKFSLDDEISEEELRAVVLGSGSNKSPGPDGYSNEFYKRFWSLLHILLLNLMNFFFINKNISQNHLMGTITCIPKGDKLRNKLKNWRPITLLNSIYKFYSGIWANRIKKHLPKLIGDSQTGFVQNRFIGENTRLTLDILNEAQSENTSGLLILVDFEKAFDSISWDFISKILKLFNFSDHTIQVIKSLQKNSFSKIIQNGHSSELIRLGRGCRQGDPISPYIFVLAVELLGVSVRIHKDLEGFKIRNTEHRISQFADDTNMFILNNERNLRLCMNILEEFHLISGLKINMDKTKVVKFGRDRDSSDNICPDLNLLWTNKFTSLGIEYDATDLDNITDLNIEPKLIEIQKLIRIWQLRNLTIVGKITIIKSLLISKFIHILLSLPSPKETLFKRIESLFDLFLWNGSTPKFRRDIMENKVEDGGLQYPNLRHVDATMKVSWFKRLYKSNEGWASIPNFYNMNDIYLYGDLYQKKLLQTVTNVFWRDTIKSLLLINKHGVFHGTESLLSTPIWYNSMVLSGINRHWVEKGLRTIYDLIDDKGVILSMKDMNSKWNIECNFLLYFKLKEKISNICQNQRNLFLNTAPQMSHILYEVEVCNKGNKNIYYNSLGVNHQPIAALQEKWCQNLNEEISFHIISMAFKTAKMFSPSIYQYFLQYKLIHRRTVTNILLKKMKIIDTDLCYFCKEIETIEHAYLNCANSASLWVNSIAWVRNIHDPHFIVSDIEKIFGCSPGNQIANLFIISVRDVIYQKRKDGSKMCITDVKMCFVKNLSILKSKDLSDKAIVTFENRWSNFIRDFKNDERVKKSWYKL